LIDRPLLGEPQAIYCFQSAEPEGLPVASTAAGASLRIAEGKQCLIKLVCCSTIGSTNQGFEIRYHGKAFTIAMKAGVVGTNVK
jgi:hypothetical protein